MGFIKWFKNDGNFSPASLKSALNMTATSTLSKKMRLRRNTSYLNALQRFNQWRETHLANGNPKQNQKKNQHRQQEQQHQQQNHDQSHFNMSDLHYEKIDAPNSSYLMPTSVNDSEMAMTALNYLLKSSEKKKKRKPVFNLDVDYSAVEPDYALPYRSEENICTSTKMITDLDNTLLEYSKNYMSVSMGDDDIDLHLFTSELLVCYSSDIVPMQTRNATQNYLQHGVVDAIEISYVRDPNAISKQHPHHSPHRQQRQHHHQSMLKSFHSLRKLRHPNIVLLMGVLLNEADKLDGLILEPLKCTLFECIYRQKHQIAINQCLLYAIQLVNAVIYLHKRWMTHGNIRSMCVLLCKTTNVVKLMFEGTLPAEKKCDAINYRNDHRGYCCANMHNKSFYEEISIEHTGNAITATTSTPTTIPTTAAAATRATLYRLDIYGVCITLWEMLNCVVPHTQLSQYATLPMYERERCLPFKRILERGLGISEQCIGSAIDLRNELKCLQYIIAKK